MDRHVERQKHAEWLTGVVSSAIANWSMRTAKEIIRPQDFPLALIREDRPAVTKRVNRQAVANQVRSLFRAQIESQRG